MAWLGKNRTDGSGGASRPLARADELIVEHVGDEILVYDQVEHNAHCLSATAARVWQACDGTTSVHDLATELDLDSDTVARALEELAACALLVSGPGSANGSTRRELSIRLAKVGAAVTAAPLVLSIVAPTPALASSQAMCLAVGCVQDCGICHSKTNGLCCACCGPGNSTTSADKICTADCSTTHCNDTVRASHCGTVSPSSACNIPGSC